MRRALLTGALLGAMLWVAPARAADALEPYRAFVRTAAARALLAEARATMRAHFAGADSAAAGASAAAGGAVAAIAAGATPDTLAWPGAPTGAYLTLARGRATRACIGSATPRGGSLRETVRALALDVLQADRRRPPVAGEELDSLRVTLAFAGPAQPVRDPMTIRPAWDGLLVSGPHGSVAFLPGEARTVAWALREARRIGVMSDVREATFERFDVVTIAEPAPPAASAPARDAGEP